MFVFVAEPESADLGRFELSHISSLVKKFLAHLPNPVIPVQVYDEMLALAEGTYFLTWASRMTDMLTICRDYGMVQCLREGDRVNRMSSFAISRH